MVSGYVNCSQRFINAMLTGTGYRGIYDEAILYSSLSKLVVMDVNMAGTRIVSTVTIANDAQGVHFTAILAGRQSLTTIKPDDSVVVDL